MKSRSDRNEEEVAGKVSESWCGTQNILVYSCGNESQCINKPYCGVFHVSPFVIMLLSLPLIRSDLSLKEKMRLRVTINLEVYFFLICSVQHGESPESPIIICDMGFACINKKPQR